MQVFFPLEDDALVVFSQHSERERVPATHIAFKEIVLPIQREIFGTESPHLTVVLSKLL